MGSITLAGRQIFILNENDRYPKPHQKSKSKQILI
ncbi:hypothetical protein SAMN02744783_03202 [Serratia sp. CC22-02]|nr:hypothetical protein SAMN02744783_03202 [Serratia sp. CC22-02]